MDDYDVLLLLEDYKMDITLPSYRDKKRFEERSLKRWAVDELKVYILAHVKLTPDKACEAFISRMKVYMKLHTSKKKLLTTVLNVAEDIFDVLRASQGGL